MGSARSVIRGLIGTKLPRGYYDTSATTGTSTTKELVDSKRVEDRDFWNGAYIKVGSNEVRVRGGSGAGRLYLDRALAAGAPASGTSYEIVKGWTIDDLNDGIDWSLLKGYPWIYLPIDDDTTNEEAANVREITLPATWLDIKYVRREVKNSSPQEFYGLVRGVDYELRVGSTGALVFEMLYKPDAGRDLHFVGEGIMTLAAADASTCAAADELLVQGGLWYLYEKGIQPDEPALSASFPAKAQMAERRFTEARSTFAMVRESKEIRRPHVVVSNDGSSVSR